MSLRIKEVTGSGVKEGKHITAALKKQGKNEEEITSMLEYTKLVIEDDSTAATDSKLIVEIKENLAVWADRLEAGGFVAMANSFRSDKAIRSLMSVENQSIAHLESLGITEEQVAPTVRADKDV